MRISVLGAVPLYVLKCHIYPPGKTTIFVVCDCLALGENYSMHYFYSILFSQQPTFNIEIPQSLVRNYHSTPSNMCIPMRGGPDGVKKNMNPDAMACEPL